MRMTKIFKKLVAFLLVMVCITNVQCVNANAVEKKEDRLSAYVENILPQYLSANGLLADEYKVSEPIALYNWETGESEKTFFLVFEGDNVVGQMVVQCYEGEYYSSFNTSYLDVLTNVYREKTPVAFGSYNECFVMRTATEKVLLSVANKDNPLKGLLDNVQKGISNLNDLQPITRNETIKVSPAVSQQRTIVYNKQLNVEWVGNIEVDGRGLCWAACVAAKVNYQKGTDLSARDVYNRLICIYDGTPAGNNLWIERAYWLYEMDATILNNSVGAGVCLMQLISEKPIHIGIGGSNESGEDVSHSVLISGVNYTDVSGAAGIYTLMDPNVPSPVTLGVSPSVIQNGSGFYYVRSYGSEEYTFTEWNKTRY